MNLINKNLLVLLSLLCSCTFVGSRFETPAHEFADELETATPDFKQGWLDGCQSGMKSGSNSFQQTFLKSHQDGFKMAYSKDYQIAWNNSYWYCYRTDWTNQRSTIYSSFFGGLR